MTFPPITTEAVAADLMAWTLSDKARSNDPMGDLATVAIRADRKVLAEQGYAIVHKEDVAKNDVWIRYMNEQGFHLIKEGEIPPWMEQTSNTTCDHGYYNVECSEHDVPHYRLKAES